MKDHKYKEFSKMILYEESSKVEVDINSLTVESDYKGPRLDGGADTITPEFVVAVMEYFKDQKVLHKKFAWMLITRCREIFEKEKNIVDITIPEDNAREVTVCGDIHG